MKAMKYSFLFGFVFAITITEVFADEGQSSTAGHGFGEDINWVPWDDALSEARKLHKPVFLLIHKTWCGACKALKTEFKSSNKRKELVELSREFIMVNTEDDEEPSDEKYAPDGGYVPRTLMLDENGDLLDGTTNKNYPSNKYYFPRIPPLIEAMKKALESYKKPSDDDEAEQSKAKQVNENEVKDSKEDDDGKDSKNEL